MMLYKGDMYRDDRIFVLNLSRGTVQKKSKKETRWLLSTYRNIVSLPCRSVRDFETQEEAIEYIKKVEPDTPMISNNGESLDIPEGFEPWEVWLKWLGENNLKSAITGHQNVPEWVKKEYGEPKSGYVEVLELNEKDLD